MSVGFEMMEMLGLEARLRALRAEGGPAVPEGVSAGTAVDSLLLLLDAARGLRPPAGEGRLGELRSVEADLRGGGLGPPGGESRVRLAAAVEDLLELLYIERLRGREALPSEAGRPGDVAVRTAGEGEEVHARLLVMNTGARGGCDVELSLPESRRLADLLVSMEPRPREGGPPGQFLRAVRCGVGLSAVFVAVHESRETSAVLRHDQAAPAADGILRSAGAGEGLAWSRDELRDVSRAAESVVRDRETVEEAAAACRARGAEEGWVRSGAEVSACLHGMLWGRGVAMDGAGG